MSLQPSGNKLAFNFCQLLLGHSLGDIQYMFCFTIWILDFLDDCVAAIVVAAGKGSGMAIIAALAELNGKVKLLLYTCNIYT